MQITAVRIRLIPNKPRLKAVASVTLDNALILNDIKVIQTENRLCVEFPRNPYARDSNHIEYIVMPLSMVVRLDFEKQIITKYESAVLSFIRKSRKKLQGQAVI